MTRAVRRAQAFDAAFLGNLAHYWSIRRDFAMYFERNRENLNRDLRSLGLPINDCGTDVAATPDVVVVHPWLSVRALGLRGAASMSSVAISLGALCCASGAVAHFVDTTHRKEGVFGLGGFIFLMIGMYLTRA